MADLNLTGAFTLDSATIDKLVKATFGIYVLGDKERTAMRVGRSDDNLAERIKDYLGDSDYKICTMFWFQHAESKKTAFELECVAYHKYKPSLNDIHPDRPNGTNYTCPVDGCGS